MPKTDDPIALLRSITPDTKPESVYILYGDEPYFTEKVERKLIDTWVDKESADFNYTLLYGNETSGAAVLSSLLRYPMMAKRVVVLVREAQLLTGFDALESLPACTLNDNILILSYHGGKPDARSKAYKALEKMALVVESKEIRDYQVSKYVPAIAQEHGLQLDSAATALLIEHLGADIVQMDRELGKLAVVLAGHSQSTVTQQMIEQYTSITRQVSPFELKSAIAHRDVARATKLAMMMAADPKGSPVQMTISMLFNFFSDLLLAYHAPNKSEAGVAAYLDLGGRTFLARDYLTAMRCYRENKVYNIISYLRKCDARSKGMYGGYSDQGEVLLDMIYFITH